MLKFNHNNMIPHRIKKVPVTKTVLKNGSHYPIEAEALADLHRYCLAFIHAQLAG